MNLKQMMQLIINLKGLMFALLMATLMGCQSTGGLGAAPPPPQVHFEQSNPDAPEVAPVDTQTKTDPVPAPPANPNDTRRDLPLAGASDPLPLPERNNGEPEILSQASQGQEIAIRGSTNIRNAGVVLPHLEFDELGFDRDRLTRIYTTKIKRVFVLVKRGEGMVVHKYPDGRTEAVRLTSSTLEDSLPGNQQTAAFLIVVNFNFDHKESGVDMRTRRVASMRNVIMRISHQESMNEENIDIDFSNYMVLPDPILGEEGHKIALVYSLSQYMLDMFACGYFATFNFMYSDQPGDPNVAPADRPVCAEWDTRVHRDDFARQRLNLNDGTDLFSFARFSYEMGEGWRFRIVEHRDPDTGEVKCGMTFEQTDPRQRDEARMRLEGREVID